ncbi:hypothetical protein ABIE33_002658 [Ensifer sp. 4252]
MSAETYDRCRISVAVQSETCGNGYLQVIGKVVACREHLCRQAHLSQSLGKGPDLPAFIPVAVCPAFDVSVHYQTRWLQL